MWGLHRENPGQQKKTMSSGPTTSSTAKPRISMLLTVKLLPQIQDRAAAVPPFHYPCIRGALPALWEEIQGYERTGNGEEGLKISTLGRAGRKASTGYTLPRTAGRPAPSLSESRETAGQPTPTWTFLSPGCGHSHFSLSLRA